MLVANTDSANACPTSASSASAIVIATIAISNGTSPATSEPNTISSTISAAGSPNQLAVLQVLPGQVEEVVVERELAGDRGVESVAPVGALHRLDDVLDVVLGIAAEGASIAVASRSSETSRRSPAS